MTRWSVIALQATPTVTPIETGLDAMRAIVALVAVMLVMVGFLWLLKRGTFTAMSRGKGQPLAIESAMSLGDRRSLVIVSVEGRRLLLGLSPTQVSLLTELTHRPAFGAALEGAIASTEGRQS
jgi:flagellar protein FliO/FliZ